MGKRQRDCAVCGAPVGIIGRSRCCRCTARIREAEAKGVCPDCGRGRVLDAATGRCVRCSRRCTECSRPVRSSGAVLCKTCRRRSERLASRKDCPRCGRPGYLRPETGWCGTCSRPATHAGPPRVCSRCGRLRRHAAHGLCSACSQRDPAMPFTRAEGLSAALTDPPEWLGGFAAHVAGRFAPSRAAALVSELGRLLKDDESNTPSALLDRSRLAGRSMGSLARSLEDFFTLLGLALPTDQAERLAAGRRQRIIDATPEPLTAGTAGFAEALLRARERARRAGTTPRADSTIEHALGIVRDLARFLCTDRGKEQWSLVEARDIESFLALLPRSRARRLSVLRQFFRHARARRLVLVDPVAGLGAKQHRGFRGRALELREQRRLFRRWSTDDTVHPHEALVGILALLHGASSQEARMLRVEDIDPPTRSLRLGARPHPVPLDPVTWAAIERCLAHRRAQGTANPYVLVTKGTKAGSRPASTAYLHHVLDAAGITPWVLRSTRMLAMVNTLDPKLVAAALGLDAQAPLIYLADRVDPDRLPAVNP